MKQSERLEWIVREVQEHGEVRVADLAAKLGTSEVSIRTDLRKLDEDGVIKKTHGGATRVDEGLKVPFAPGEFYLNGGIKQRIAQKAFDYIEDDDSIMIDDSTTCCYLANLIAAHPEKKLAVVTNSLYAAALLAGRPYIDLYVLGGRVLSSPPSMIDTAAAESVSRYHVKKFFTGINRIDAGIGLSSMDAMHMEVKKMMIQAAEQTYVLADHTKFGRGGLFLVCEIEQLHCIITDSGLPGNELEQLQRHDIILEIV